MSCRDELFFGWSTYFDCFLFYFFFLPTASHSTEKVLGDGVLARHPSNIIYIYFFLRYNKACKPLAQRSTIMPDQQIKVCVGQTETHAGSVDISRWSPTQDSWLRQNVSELVLFTMSMRTRNSCNLDGQGLIRNDTSNDGSTCKMKKYYLRIHSCKTHPKINSPTKDFQNHNEPETLRNHLLENDPETLRNH